MRFRAMPSLNVLFLAFALLCLTRHVLGVALKKDTGKCIFKEYKEEHELKSVERIRSLIGKSFPSNGQIGGDEYQFRVGICADLGLNDQSGATQLKLKPTGKVDKDTTPTPVNIGSLTNSHLMSGNDWALLQYEEGERYKNHCGNLPRRTAILLSCGEGVGDEEAKMIFVEEDKQKDSECYYLFEMKHKALCPVYSKSSTLSIGSILVIVFISVLAVYLLVGFAYQRFVLGSKGLEQIPNYEFWKDFGNLQADGCDLVCRTKERRSTGFRGIGDEQLETAEEVRDDNLLPM